jgi:hypothetical protein
MLLSIRGMKTILLSWATLLLVGRAVAVSAEAEVHLSADFTKPIRTLRGGIGASWHAIEAEIPTGVKHPMFAGPAHGGSAWGGNPPAEDNARWRQIEHHADWLGLDFIRVEIEQRMWQPERDRFTPETPEMRILYRILDWCEKRHADVFLQVMWGNVDWNAFPEFRGNAVTRVHSGPRDMSAFADSLAALMKHLTRTKRYSCIRWLCINNEPGAEWSWWQKPPNQSMAIREGLAAVRGALDRAGIQIPLSGPDWTDLPELKAEKIDFDEFIGAYDLHSYYARFDWAKTQGYPIGDAEKRLIAWRMWANARGKPLFLSEVGTMVYGWGGSSPGPATFEAALKDAELVVRGLSAGVEGFNRWSFVNRGDLDGEWQMISTWDSTNKALRKTITPFPNSYFVYGLISRLTAKHSTLVATERSGGELEGLPRVFAAALVSPKGHATWIVVNDAPRAWNAEFHLAGLRGVPLYKYQVSSADRDQPGLKIQPGRVPRLTSEPGSLHDPLPAKSLTVLSTYKLSANAPGVISE